MNLFKISHSSTKGGKYLWVRRLLAKSPDTGSLALYGCAIITLQNCRWMIRCAGAVQGVLRTVARERQASCLFYSHGNERGPAETADKLVHSLIYLVTTAIWLNLSMNRILAHFSVALLAFSPFSLELIHRWVALTMQQEFIACQLHFLLDLNFFLAFFLIFSCLLLVN